MIKYVCLSSQSVKFLFNYNIEIFISVLFNHISRESRLSFTQEMALPTTHHLYFLPMTALCEDHVTSADVVRRWDTDQRLSSVLHHLNCAFIHYWIEFDMNVELVYLNTYMKISDIFYT